ncbi:phosphate ABC transporter substrate-binding protein [Prosthecobacter sp.]|uniref:phosphate ABC transporter substrate-binding protein n=1 Tax=Prosthecobacter sp. TaxID=1965333 RepID=UPI002AB8AB56|nr:phosphate ABC transporter substrate-binding protein [Prosthecobacter sp.]MDZ4402639.1 phosphate ABC transporter substrate-binding protein [Prosthecobacter sp.]
MKRCLFATALLLSHSFAEEPKPAISGIWLMGQSLCDGSESLPIVTTDVTGWGNFAFKRGVRTWLPRDNSATPEKRPAEQFRLVPLRAQANGGLGETVASGLADHLKAALVGAKKNGPPHFLVACAGQGGRQIQELSSADLSTDERTPESRRNGGGYYRTSLDDARRAMEQAKAMGASFRIEALYWMQGEGNGGPTGGIMPTRWDTELPRAQGLAWYRDQLMAYRKQWSADLCAITGQRGELPMFTYQTLSQSGDAQLMAADAVTSIYMVGPHYAVPSAINSRTTLGRHGDAIHLSADGERWWGEQVGKVMHRVLHKNEDWQPLRPRRAKLDATRDGVVIEFTVPRPPLVIDMNFLMRQEIAIKGGFTSLAGFQVRGGGGQTLTLTSVEVVSPTNVRIRFAKALPASEKCRVNYCHPFAAALGAIAVIQKTADGDEELVLTRRFAKELKPLTDEGAFLVTNTSGTNTRVPIRSVREENGVTVLRYEPRELRNGTPFAIGQPVVAQRSFSYGNLRDSDAERSVHTFADAAYGTRVGQPYPLWNWCVLFSDFEVE